MVCIICFVDELCFLCGGYLLLAESLIVVTAIETLGL